ncbi:MAG: type II toxin-antitoxin system RelE/ParE family toxin [Alphaproteobacteria bacterium]|nr:type II toxin-antitoxin system RelE/ParE family toxin [Alphaproteobacteria bacterium]
MTYRLYPQAQDDMRDVWFFLGTRNPRAATTMMRKFFKTFQLLAAHPQLGRERYDIRAKIRSVTCFPYVVFYQISGKHVDIVRILHGARDMTGLFDQG